jgi:aminopeptidase N
MRRRVVVVVAALVVATGAAVAVSRSGSSPGGASRTTSSSGDPSATTPAPGSSGSGPATLVPIPRAGAVTQESIGDPLFPGLGNGGYDVENYDLHVTYPGKDPAQAVALGETITARATGRLTAFDLDFAGHGPSAVTVDGKPASAVRSGQELVITPAAPVAAGTTFTVGIDGVSAAPVAVRPGVAGTEPFLSSQDGTVLAGQPNGMHQVFPCDDHPSDKATFTFALDVPSGWTAVANGVLVGRTDIAGRTVWRYREAHQLATELVQIAAGDLRIAQLPAVDGVARRDVVPTRLASTLLPRLAPISGYVSWMESQVGPYPFETYGALVVEGRLGFSLETQTLPIFDTGVLGSPVAAQRERVLVHELAHQWFGDSVSPDIWSDVWLNEGHATWYQLAYAAEHGSLAQLTNGGATTLDQYMRLVYGTSNTLRARYGPPGGPRNGGPGLFNPDVYDGAALALYALRQEVGPGAFARIERQWVTLHRDGVASTADFASLASRVAGRDVRAFLDGWLYGTTAPPMPGHPDWASAAPAVSGT